MFNGRGSQLRFAPSAVRWRLAPPLEVLPRPGPVRAGGLQPLRGFRLPP